MDEFLLEQGVGFDGGGYFELPCCETVPPGFIPEPVYVPPPQVFEPAPVSQPAPTPIYQAPEPIYFEPEPVFFELPYVEPMPVYQEPEPVFFDQPFIPEPIARVEFASPVFEPVAFTQPSFIEQAPYFEPEQFFALPYIEPEPPPSPFIPPIAAPPVVAPVFQPSVFEPEPIREEFFSLPYEGFELVQEPQMAITQAAPVFEPAPIVEEQVFFALPPPPEPLPAPVFSDWAFCANSREWCGFTGQQEVRYGKGDIWTAPQVFTDGADCRSATFGYDPLPGVVKECQTRVALQSAPIFAPVPMPVIEEQFFGLPFEGFEPAPPPVFEPAPVFQPIPFIQVAPELGPISTDAFVIEQPAPQFMPFVPEPIIEEQFFAPPEPPFVPPAPVFTAEPEPFIAPVAPEPPPASFFRCRPCTDGGASGFNWGGVYGDGFLY